MKKKKVIFDNEHIELGLLVDEVAIRRYEGPDYRFIGSPILVRPIIDTAEDLVNSAHMKKWLMKRVVTALLKGKRFVYRGPEGLKRATYRLRTDEEETKQRVTRKVAEASNPVKWRPVFVHKEIRTVIYQMIDDGEKTTSKTIVKQMKLDESYIPQIKESLKRLKDAEKIRLKDGQWIRRQRG